MRKFSARFTPTTVTARLLTLIAVLALVTAATATAYMKGAFVPQQEQEQAKPASRVSLKDKKTTIDKDAKEGQGEAPTQNLITPLVASSGNYVFSTSATGSLALDRNGNTVDLTTGTVTNLVAASADDTPSALTNIGFDFYFMGTRYSQFSTSDNGIIQLGSVISSSLYALPSTTLPLIAPFGEDMRVGTNGIIRSKVIGTAPNRVLVVEYSNIMIRYLNPAAAGTGTFQARLYESTGVIEFVYGAMATNSATQNPAYIGFSSNGSTAGTFATVTTSTHTANTTGTLASNTYASSATITDLNSAANGSRRVYTFVPPVPNAPTNLTFTNVAPASVTLNWTDNATNEAGFPVYVSTDGTNFSFLGQAAENATSFNATGLTPNTTYTFKVFSVSEGALSTTAPTGTQATTAAGNISSTATGGLWSAPATWVGGVVPTAGDNVTIVNGATVTIDIAANAFSLTVGTGTSGILQFEQTTARTLTVGTDVTIAVGGTFRSNTAGTVTTHNLSLGGSLTNNGTLNFNAIAATGAQIIFTGSTDASFTLNAGSTTNLRQTTGVTLNKGTSSTPVLTFTPGGTFTVQGANTAGFLVITNGTFKIAGTATLSNPVFNVAAYTIPATGGFWLTNPNFTVVALNGTSQLNGTFRMDSGTFNSGTAQGNRFGYDSGSVFTLNGGTFNQASRFSATNTVGITYTQTGGTFNVTTVSNTSTTIAGFDITSGSFTMSGGTIALQIAGTGGSGPRDYRNTATVNITGGTLQAGNASSGTAKTFTIQGAVPNLVISNTSANHTVQLQAQTNVYRDTTIPTGTTLNLNGFLLLQIGTNIVNNGTLSGNTSGSTLYFLGSGAQTYSGSGICGTAAAPLLTLSIDTPSLTINSGTTNNIVTNRVNFFSGGIINSNKVTLGSGGTSTAVVQIGVTGATSAITAFDVAPTFNLGSGGQIVIYAQEIATRTTGVEINPTRILTSMIVANTNNLTIAGGDLTLSSTATALTLTDGRVITGANTLILSSGTAAVTRTNGYVDGNLRKTFTATGSKTFEVGTANGYSPLGVNATAGTGTLTVKATQTKQPNISGTNALSRYWTITQAAGGTLTATLTFNYLATDVVGTEANYKIFKYNGSFTQFNPTTLNTTTHVATLAGVNSFSDWTLAEPTAVQAGSLQFDAPSYSVNENAGTVTLNVTRTGGTDGIVSVSYSTVDGTATSGAGNDYTGQSGTLTWAAGDSAPKSITIALLDDAVYEGNEIFNVNITNPTGTATLGTPNNVPVTITENDPAPAFSVDDVTHNEGDSGTTSYTFTVTKTGSTALASNVDIATQDGTATAGSDYAANSATLTFAAGDTTQQFTVLVNGDTTVEPDETFNVNLTNPTGGATIADAQGVGTITNDDVVPATLVVNTNDDLNGTCTVAHCSLREAINAANSNADTNTITFNIGGTGVHTISPASPLPDITSPAFIDGYTQPGSSPNSADTIDNAVIQIELDGTGAGAGADGLRFAANDSGVRGLVINRFTRHGIVLVASTGFGDNNNIRGNFIGTDALGTLDLGNGGNGISNEIAVFGQGTDNNQIGGLTRASRNIISGNNAAGITFDFGTGNIVQGNFIGLGADGATAIGNGTFGVAAGSFTSGTIIGGDDAADGTADNNVDARNYVSGNGGAGLALGGSGFGGVTVKGNFIGTDTTGTLARPNNGGITTNIAGTTVIGGTTAGAGNLISGNTGDGINVGNTGGITIKGNRIGTRVGGLTTLPNTGDGIEIIAGGTNNIIGGIAANEANIIAFNGLNGVQITDVANAPTNNPVRGNSIFSNGGLGINLGQDAVTPNDALDADAGANNLQNFPVITNAKVNAASNTIDGTLNSTAGQVFTIDFYTNTTCDASGNGEGQTYLGTITTGMTDSNGDVAFTYNPATLTAGESVTATATDANGNTSEFSACATVAAAQMGSLQFSAANYNDSETNTTHDAAITVTRTGGTDGAVSVHYATSDGTATTADNDYTATSGDLTWTDGDATDKTFTVSVTGDTNFESDETVNLTLSNPTGGATLGTPNTATLTIQNDDAQPQAFSISDAAPVTEGNSGTTNATFTVTLGVAAFNHTDGSANVAPGYTVHYNTVDGTATAGTGDYQATSGDLTFSGPGTQTINVAVNGDTYLEADETFTVHLSNPTGATIADADGNGTITNDDAFQATVTITPATTPTAFDNDYTRINNAIQNSSAGQIIVLSGTFNWTEPNAAASWRLGSDGIADTGDEYGITPPDQLNNVTLTASSPGSATIQGPGDITGTDATFDLEGVLAFFYGTNQNWTISNINFFDFDLAIGFFNGAGIPDNAYNNTHITNNHIRMAADSTTDALQNIGILYGFGTSQLISGNTIDIQGNAISDSGNGNSAVDVAMQSNASGGTLYDGLQITNNIVKVLNAPAADPELVLGIWENGHAHQSNITVSGNTFTHDTGVANTAATNKETGFIITSHSSATTTVKYMSNTVTGANLGFQWLPGQPDYAGQQPVQLTGNTITGNFTGVNVLSQGVAQLTGNTINTNSNGVLVEQQSTVGLTGNDINGNTVNGVLVRDAAPSPTPSPSPTPTPSPLSGSLASEPQSFNETAIRSAQRRGAAISTRSRGGAANVEGGKVIAPSSAPIANGFVGSQGVVTLTSNNLLGNVTGVLGQGQNSVTLHFNHIFGNIATGVNNAGSVVIDAENNFWGCNAGPGATGCDSVTSNVDFDPWLILSISASPSSINAGGTSTITADLTHNSAGMNTASGGVFVPPTPVTFGATNGTVNPTSGTITNGVATTTFTPSGNSSGTASATVDNQTVTTPVTVVTPTISINDVTFTGVNSIAGKTAVVPPSGFTVTLNAASTQTVTVHYTTADGTALAGEDYVTTSGTLTFMPGETSKPIPVSIVPDTRNEPTETFFVNLDMPTNATIADAQGVGTIPNDDPQPSLTINDLLISEPDTVGGTSTANFKVSLSAASGQTVTVHYSTANGTATAPADYVGIPDTTLTFAPGETTKTVSVTINGDGVAEGNETFFVNLSNATNATIADAQGQGTITDAVLAGQVVISEFRFHGAQGGQDEFVELYNNTDAPITVATTDGTSGWALARNNGSTMFTIPNGTSIPARAHFLAVNGGGYSLANYGGTGKAAGDLVYTQEDIQDNDGIALFKTTFPENFFTGGYRLDAAGFASVGVNFREGAGLAPIPILDGEYSFTRKTVLASDAVQDTDNNANDFNFVATDGNATFASAMLGAPGPENLGSPTVKHNAQFPASYLEPMTGRNLPPNRVRTICTDPTRPENCDPNKSAAGFLSIRRRFTNMTGAPVSRLRFRIVDFTTLGNDGGSPATTADLRALSSMDITVNTTTNPLGETVRGTTLEQPPTQTSKGGGLNSTLAAGTITPSSTLANGDTINVQFMLGVMRGGNFRFLVIIEAAP